MEIPVSNTDFLITIDPYIFKKVSKYIPCQESLIKAVKELILCFAYPDFKNIHTLLNDAHMFMIKDKNSEQIIVYSKNRRLNHTTLVINSSAKKFYKVANDVKEIDSEFFVNILSSINSENEMIPKLVSLLESEKKTFFKNKVLISLNPMSSEVTSSSPSLSVSSFINEEFKTKLHMKVKTIFKEILRESLQEAVQEVLEETDIAKLIKLT